MSSLLGKYKIAVDTATLADGDSIASYLVSAAGLLLTSTTLGAKEHLDALDASSHIDGSAYVPTSDYLASAGVVDSNGNWVPLTLNAAGELPVAATVNFSGDYAEDSPHTSGDVGLFTLLVRQDTLAASTSADGDYGAFKSNNLGELYVHDTSVLAQLVSANTTLSNTYTELLDQGTTLDAILADTATIDSQTLSIQNTLTALSKAEDAPHSSGDQGIQSLLVRQDSLASSTSADGDYGSFKSNASGELYVTDATLRTTLSALSKAEDAVHTSGDQGIQALAVRKDAQGSNVSADGDYSSLQTWSEGSLKVVDIANSSVLQQQISVTSTAAQLPATSLANRRSLMIQNTGSAKCYIGSATVTVSGATAGIELPANSFMELEAGPACAVYAIKNGAGGNTVNILEMA